MKSAILFFLDRLVVPRKDFDALIYLSSVISFDMLIKSDHLIGHAIEI